MDRISHLKSNIQQLVKLVKEKMTNPDRVDN